MAHVCVGNNFAEKKTNKKSQDCAKMGDQFDQLIFFDI